MLCIDANIVAALYGVELTIDLSRLRATINGPPTATERRLLRAQNQRRISNGNTDTSLKDADFAGYDEKALNHIRMTVSSRYQRRGGRNGTASETGSVFTDARFDAFRSRMKIIVNASQSKGTTRKDGITDFRISSQRVNPGDATYTEFNIGDVTPYRVVNGGSTKPGVGFRLTNRPLHQPQIVGEEVISGDAPPGWEVELYLDDSLIDVVTVDDSGQYEFPAASLKSGKNNFTIKIHGPEGQLQTIERNVFANHGVPPKGTLRYAVSAQQDDRTLTGNREHYRRKTSPDSFRGRQRDRFASDLRYATTNETALTGGFSHIPHKDSDNHLSTIGVRSNLAGRTYTLDVTKAGGDATGTAIRAYTRLLMGSASGNITYRHYDNFSGQAAKYGFSYHRNKLDIHMNMPFRNLGNDNKTSLYNSIRYSNNAIRDGRRIETLAPRISWHRPGVNLSTSFDLKRTTSHNRKKKHTSSTLLSTTRYFGDKQLLGNIHGTIQPLAKITSYRIRYQNRHSSNLTTTIRFSHHPNIGSKKKGKQAKLGHDAETKSLQAGCGG